MKTLATLLVLSFLAAPLAGLVAADFPEGSPKFKSSLSSALEDAKKQDKPVIAIFSAVWCGPCQQMKHDVYPSKTVKPFHDQFVWAYLDADAASNEGDMKKFGVTGIPHIEFLDKNGKSLGQQVGSSPADAFAKTLSGILKKAGGGKTANVKS